MFSHLLNNFAPLPASTKIKQEGQTAGFGPCFHLPGLKLRTGFLSHNQLVPTIFGGFNGKQQDKEPIFKDSGKGLDMKMLGNPLPDSFSGNMFTSSIQIGKLRFGPGFARSNVDPSDEEAHRIHCVCWTVPSKSGLKP